ncbi:AraC-type DNA-binding protein [Micromonospora phaseoli]|uniref:AraC-type DNA-binding protein n=2 Tax=Micromonospora phaseoli TaxID=1144548 RepID=A0A1H6WH15_9ACTN|nr:AraC-like DNA-binding protein [Micromonospora phaseoli]GIJ80683.1 hypothetical protein Xph01_51150 [Micromonospora phaseoli]SEJ12100.1 AraC-type DNA-binding protein [Micromonospora phaseoli]
MYELALPLTGDSALVQERRESVIRPTEFTFLTTSRPYECRHLPERETAPSGGTDPAPPATSSTVAILVPQSAVPLPQQKVVRLLAGRMRTEGMTALLAQFLVQVGEHPEQFRTAAAGQLDRMALDLVSATLAQHLDLEDALPVEVRQQGFRARIDAFITAHLGDVDLNARTIAAAHHISLRTLYRLWADEGTSIAELIRHRRLERCRHDLANPLLAGQPIYAIAARWGFADKASFARLFRATYGLTPQEYRQTSAPPQA